MRVLALAFVLLVSACSVYVPQPPDTPPPVGAEVRARLTPEGVVHVSEILGAPVLDVEGRILSADGGFLNLGLLSAGGNKRLGDSSDTLRVATGEILQLEEKRIDRRRSALLAGGVGVVSGVVLAAMFKSVNRRDSGVLDGEIEMILIPLFSIRH